MLRKWKEKERWSGRRRSEPYGAEEEEEEERQVNRRMTRRKSEPCGQMQEEKKECRRRDSVEEEWGRGRRRHSSSVMTTEDKAGGHLDRRCTRRRRSEPCGTLHIQLLPVSNRKRKELLKRHAGGTSCSELVQPRTAAEDRHVPRGRSQPTGPLDHSEHNHSDTNIHCQRPHIASGTSLGISSILMRSSVIGWCGYPVTLHPIITANVFVTISFSFRL